MGSDSHPQVLTSAGRMEASLSKRKSIPDFFLPRPKRTTNDTKGPDRSKSNSIKEAVADCVPGLTLWSDFISETEENEILNFLNDARKCTWRTDLSRRTMHLGGTYCLLPSKCAAQSEIFAPQVLQAPAMPIELSWLIQRMVEASIFPADRKPQYCIVNEYIGSQGISAHTENFKFGEPVVGLSLLSPSSIRFHELTRPFDGSVRSGKAGKAEKSGKIVDVQLPGKSLLVMKGESRWKWQHEILRSKQGRGARWKRVSLTFRYKNE